QRRRRARLDAGADLVRHRVQLVGGDAEEARHRRRARGQAGVDGGVVGGAVAGEVDGEDRRQRRSEGAHQRERRRRRFGREQRALVLAEHAVELAAEARAPLAVEVRLLLVGDADGFEERLGDEDGVLVADGEEELAQRAVRGQPARLGFQERAVIVDGALRRRQRGEPLERGHVAAIDGDDALVLAHGGVAAIERTLEEVGEAAADGQLPRRVHRWRHRRAGRARAIERGLERRGGQVPAVGAAAEIEQAIDGVAPPRRQLDLAERLDGGGDVVELLLLQRRQLQLQLRAAIVVELAVADERGEEARRFGVIAGAL